MKYRAPLPLTLLTLSLSGAAAAAEPGSAGPPIPPARSHLEAELGTNSASANSREAAGAGASGEDASDDPFAGLPLVLEINPETVAPSDEIPEKASRVETILSRPARVLPMGNEARRMVYRLGGGHGLEAGRIYLLEVEYPDDVPRAFFMANRGADLVRGWATGTAIGDARRQYVEPSVESLAYPQTRQWQRYRQVFTLQERLQGVLAHRNADPGCRPFTPASGFHLVFFQTTRSNDPRSQGLAIGRIRLHAVPDPRRLAAPLNRPPAELPQRRIFWYPIGRLFTVAGTEPIGSYRAKSGLTVVHHYALNENDEQWERMDANTRLNYEHFCGAH